MIDDPGFGSALDGAVPDVKDYLRILDDAEDGLIGGLVGVAAQVAEAFLRQTLVRRDLVERMATCGEWRRLGATPVTSISTVEGLDGVLAPEAYAIDIDADRDGWVRVSGGSRVAVRYRAGLADDWAGLPMMLRQGLIRLVAHLHRNRDAAEDKGVPTAVIALWQPWRRFPFAMGRRSA